MGTRTRTARTTSRCDEGIVAGPARRWQAKRSSPTASLALRRDGQRRLERSWGSSGGALLVPCFRPPTVVLSGLFELYGIVSGEKRGEHRHRPRSSRDRWRRGIAGQYLPAIAFLLGAYLATPLDGHVRFV